MVRFIRFMLRAALTVMFVLMIPAVACIAWAMDGGTTYLGALQDYWDLTMEWWS